jgi:uncharacterized protein involved in type VI secretion and phage assembly
MKPTLAPVPTAAPALHYGKFRGIVLDNVDPLQIGRVTAQVPDVLGATASGWALPCVPAAGMQSGLFIVPPVGSQVWVEFERGDPAYPVWTGGFWASAADVPALATAPAAPPPGQNIVLQTTGQNAIVLSDSQAAAAGGILLKNATGAVIAVNASGIYLSNGRGAAVALVGPTVTINKQVFD